ncbi:MAG: RNA polymerase sigma-70 factor [Prolixibacteraceae bacterium]|jgi:RNA polymerase sigma-70 factor (ECF subfamily)|nr:RNA polymerase sigma-70 factor [Prolixibacteraceae bacterium]
MNGQSDIQLLNEIQDGSYGAFRLLFERYYNPLCNFSFRFLKDGFIVEDIVQEVFTKIWEDRKTLRISGSVKSYLYVAVKNRCLNKIKAESIRHEFASRFSGQEEIPIDGAIIEQEEFRNYLSMCIEKLPPRCREVFAKSRFEGMKQEKIAASLDISLKTVKAQIGKALKLIRDCLQVSYPEYL